MDTAFRGKWSTLAALAVVVALVSCSLHSVSETPEPVAREGDTLRLSWPEGTLDPRPWWQSFGNPSLDEYVITALASNLTVGQGRARAVRALAEIKQDSADLWPQLDLIGSAGANIDDTGDIDRDLSGGAALTWEIDLWRRIASAANAREQEALAAIDDYQGLGLLISAQVAEAYYGCIEQTLQVRLVESQLELAGNLLELTELRFLEGGASAVDVLQQRALLTEIKGRLPQARAALRGFENRLDVLVGRAPDGAGLADKGDELSPDVLLRPVGIPSELLLARPDLRVLRRVAVAEDYRIAEAIADRLPRVTLTGTAEYADTPTFSGAMGQAAANLVQPLLDWGKRAAAVDAAEARAREALLAFSEGYLVAIEEVDTTLWEEARQRERIAILAEQVEVLEQTVSESRGRYSAGITDYLPVLTAVNALQNAQRELLSERRGLISLRIRLHRAVGGPMPVLELEERENVAAGETETQDAG